MPDSDRVLELELKLAWAEDQIEALNRTVYAQQQQLDLLQRQFRLLYQQFRDAKAEVSGEPGDPREEIPPHY